MENTEVRVCYECGIKKPLSEFRKNISSTDGYDRKCKKCLKPPKKIELKLPDPNRHPGGLKPETVRAIRADRTNGYSIPRLRVEYNLSWTLIHDIVYGLCYGDVE